jgi:hypothetical protein
MGTFITCNFRKQKKVVGSRKTISHLNLKGYKKSQGAFHAFSPGKVIST